MTFKKKLENLQKITDRINEKINEIDRKLDELKGLITSRYRKDDKYKIELYTNYLTSYLQDLDVVDFSKYANVLHNIGDRLIEISVFLSLNDIPDADKLIRLFEHVVIKYNTTYFQLYDQEPVCLNDWFDVLAKHGRVKYEERRK